MNLFSCFVFLRGESQLLKNARPEAVEENANLMEQNRSNTEEAKLVPEYVNEPFAVALITTFAAIVLQGETLV